MPTGGKIKFKLKKLQLPDENDEASRQTRANKTVIFRQKSLGCKVPQTRHRWSFSECIFICNSPVTQSWRMPRASPGLCKISAVATRDVKRRPGSHQTLVTPILHRLCHQHWFSVNLSLNGLFSLIFFYLFTAGFSVSCHWSSTGYKGLFPTNWKLICVNRW